MGIAVPAGKCDICHRWVGRLWVTFAFRLYCAKCVDAALADAADLDPEDD